MSTNAESVETDPKATVVADIASIEDLYADGPPLRSKPEREEKPAVEEPKPEPVTAKVEDAAGKPAKADKTAAEDDEVEPSDVVGLKAALKATRQKAREKATRAEEYERKLQDEQRRYAELDGQARNMFAQIQQGTSQAQSQRPTPPDPFTDPEGALRHRDEIWAEQLRQVQVENAHNSYMARVVPSQRMMRQQHADYDAMEATFAEAAKADPRLWTEIRRQEFPAEYAYQVGKDIQQRQEIQQAGSFEKYIEQKVAEKMASAQTAVPTVPTSSTNLTPPANSKAPPPQSLARVPSVVPRNQGKTFNGPTPLGDLYK